VGLSTNDELLCAFAEKRLFQELKGRF